MPPLKIVVIGDTGSGKTSLISTYVKNYFPSIKTQYVFDEYKGFTTVGYDSFYIEILDSEEEYDTLRPVCYPRTRCFVLCYTPDRLSSFESITNKWLPELSHYRPGVPVVLVGCKSDIRELEAGQPSKELIAEDLASELVGLQVGRTTVKAYMECSAESAVGVKKVFEVAIKQAVEYSILRKRQR